MESKIFTALYLVIFCLQMSACGGGGGSPSPSAPAPSPTADTESPTVTATSSDSEIKLDETATLTFTFSEVISGFELTDISSLQGTLSDLTANDDNKIFTVVFTPNADTVGTVTLQIAAGSYEDGAGNAGQALASSPDLMVSYNDKIVQVDSMLTSGQASELVLVSTEIVSDLVWTQTSGTEVTFYAANSKVIGFTPNAAGNYAFEVRYKAADGSVKTLTHQFDVAAGAAVISARLGHVAIEGIAVSLAGYASADSASTAIDTSSWRWSQSAGPTVSFTDSATDGKTQVFFDAPSVDEDTVLTFTLTATFDGQTHTDKIAILVENSTIPVPPENSRFTDRVATVIPYNDTSAGAQLVDCLYSNAARFDVCTFGQSPLIAQITETPTTADIMNRVLVSHRWMGDQFKSYLDNFDPNNDFKNLLRATTGVVISYDIRPSFYDPTSGAIYLDPSDLWGTPEQRDTINQAPDFRAGFGSELQFKMPWRYVKDNAYVSFSYPLRQRSSRQLAEANYDFASLLYHELAHANDYFPSTKWSSYENFTTVYDALMQTDNAGDNLSRQLQANYPLDTRANQGGNALTKLAQVRFRNPDSITDEQKAFTPTEVAEMFKTEGAPQFYSYSSSAEDLAILFDGFMMLARYGVYRDVAVSDPQVSNIAWGQRGRLAESAIKPRVSYVATRVLPEFIEADSQLQNLPAPLPLDISKSWRDSVVISADASAEAAAQKQAAPDARHVDGLVPRNGSYHRARPQHY